MEFIAQYGLFLAKLLTFAIVAVVGFVVASALSGRGRSTPDGHLEVCKLNERYRGFHDGLVQSVLDGEAFKQWRKQEKKTHKAERKQQKANARQPASEEGGRVYVLDFLGDLRATAVNALREEISIVLAMADEKDEIILRLESPGGLVNAYGLAASQLMRIRDAGIPLTVCVDKVAASGGYMMACVGTRILAAPFAVVGSIGVVAQLPNFNRLLKRHDIDFELLTAGEHKRTLTLFGENTDEGRQKLAEELEDTHALFKDFVARNRPVVDVHAVSTGEIWYGERALENRLVDALETSDSYLQRRMDEADVYEIRFVEKKKLTERLGLHLASALRRRSFADLNGS